MKSKRLRLIVGGGAAIVAVTLVVFALFFHTNELGLTRVDLAMGGYPEMDTLRANTEAAASDFLDHRKTEIIGASSEDYEIVVDYSESSDIRSLGYRSSFYYYCWNIFLPYSLRTQSGHVATVVVHLSDGTQGHGHDPKKFRVIEALLLDERGRVSKQIE